MRSCFRLLFRLMLAGSCLVTAAWSSSVPQIVYLERNAFVARAFPEGEPERAMVRLRGKTAGQVKDILGHDYRGRRIRYWRTGDATAWVFDETGKDLPITIGVAVSHGEISLVSILVYREERGGEVHQSFFTRQFQGVRLDGERQLTRSIDGITGATLSVQAVTRIARLALFLDQLVNSPNS